jgi:hypothetical protein
MSCKSLQKTASAKFRFSFFYFFFVFGLSTCCTCVLGMGVRLDREMLMQALAQSGETSPHHAADANLSNRDLDDVSMLATETPQLANLNLAFNNLRRVQTIPKLEHLTKLNLSHNELLDVERLGSLRDLEVLNLSKNKLTSVGSIAELLNLEELWLRDNQISELHALQALGQCTSLKRLIIKPNPVCKSCADLYWPFLVHNIASLQLLDGREVGAAERDAASAFLLSTEGRKQLREAGLNSRCNARAILPAHQSAQEDSLEAGNRRPEPTRKSKQDKQSQQAESSRSGRPTRVPLSYRPAPQLAPPDSQGLVNRSKSLPGQGSGGVGEGNGGGTVHGNDAYKQLYSNGQIAVIARRDGTSEVLTCID